MRQFPDRHGGPDRAPNDPGRAAAQPGTAMRSTDTAGLPERSGAVSVLNTRHGDVDSTIGRSTRPTTRGIRTSNLATRTTGTRTTTTGPSPSAQSYPTNHAACSFEEVAQAYYDCRKRKRLTASALAFEVNLERNLRDLYEELISGEYQPGRSICFVITHPKPREVWAAEFRDRIVHHLVYNRIADRFHRRFIADSCACIPGRGTLYAAERLEAKVRSLTQNWREPAFYLQCDLANFFVSIDKRILWPLFAEQIPEPWWQDMTGRILWHDPRENFIYKGTPELLDRVPTHKRLTCQPNTHGLPIGNLSSQFFANVLLNVLDQHVKHYIKARHYVRYVDDFVILGRSTQWLEAVHTAIALFLPDRLGLHLNESKTLIYPVDRGIDFVGQIIKPWRRTVRRRVVNYALRRMATIHADHVFETANSYFGLFRQASKSHRDRARLARAVLRRGHSVNGEFTIASIRKYK